MIKSIILLTMAFACAMADVSAQYAGTTKGAATWNPPSLDESNGCTTTSTNNYPTVSFNITFPTAGVREIAAMAEDDFKYGLRIYVYQGGFPGTSTCTGLAQSADLTMQFDFSGGPVIDDFIYFAAATYTFVVTGETGGIFAVHVNPSDAVGQLSSAGPFWNQPETDSNGACQEASESTTVAFGTYSFAVPASGFYDLVAMYVNASGLDYSYITLYQGIPTAQQLSISPCNTSALYLGSTYSDAAGTYIPYVNLTAGVNYTLVVSLDQGYYGYWALQVIPTRIRFFTNTPAYTQPERDTTDSTVSCSASSEISPWGRTFFQAEESVYVIDTADPPSPFTYVDTYSFLYEGANTASPPDTCSPHLILGGDTGDITPVFAFTEIGQNYTVIVSTYSLSTVPATGAYVLYFFTGNPIGSIPTITTGATVGVVTGTTGTGTATNNGVGTGSTSSTNSNPTANSATFSSSTVSISASLSASASTVVAAAGTTRNGATTVALSATAAFVVVVSALL